MDKRLYVCTMEAEKRKLRGYKVKDKPYMRALKRAVREKGHLANLLENVVIGYGLGFDIVFVKDGKITTSAIKFEFNDLDKSNK